MESRERTECSGSNEGSDNTLQSDKHRCGLCHEIACDPVVTNSCCNQIFCSRCLKEYLERIQDNHARPCPRCTKHHFTYVSLSMKDIDEVDDRSNYSDVPHIHQQQRQANVANVDEVIGFDCNFKTPPDVDLVCKICYYPARDPQQANECCGNTFCAACLHKYTHTKSIDTTRCPCCNKVPFTFVPDKKTERYVGDLMVFCPHKSLGCDWTGELRSLEQHVAKDFNSKKGCPFTELQCSNGCGVVMQRRLVEGHLNSECELREVKCEYCNTTGSYQWINSSHQEECPKYPVECPNHCEAGHVRREEISRHLEECPLALIKCLFGCDGIQRANVTDHMKEAVTVHVERMLKYIKQLQTTKENLESEIHEMQTKLDAINHAVTSDIKTVTDNNKMAIKEIETAKDHLTNHEDMIDNLQKEVKAIKNSNEIETVERKALDKKSEELQSEIRTVEQRINEEINTRLKEVETKLTADLEQVKSEFAKTEERVSNGFTAIKQHYDKIVAEKKAELEQLNKKLQEQEEKLEERKQKHEDKLKAAKDEFKNQLQKREQELKQQFTNEMQKHEKNFKALLSLQDWGLQLNYLCMTCSNVLPNVYVKITEFALRLRRSFKSQPFYTNDKGYKMCLSVSPTSVGSNNDLSVSVLLMSGEDDNHLRWPIKGVLKIQLLNQLWDGNHGEPKNIVFDGSEDSSCCRRVVAGEISLYSNYFDKFISHRSLGEDKSRRQHFHKNDTLFLKLLEFSPSQ